MELLKINRNVTNLVHVWHQNGAYLGTANEIELLELCCQIRETKAEGYFVTIDPHANGIYYGISSWGKIQNQDQAFYDFHHNFDNLLNRILGI